MNTQGNGFLFGLSPADPAEIWGERNGLSRQGGEVHLPVGGAARPWLCGDGSEGRVLVVLPDQQQMSSFAADFGVLYGHAPFTLRELPLAVDVATARSWWLQRGEVLNAWRLRGGLLCATPGALLGPCLFADALFPISIGREVGRDALLKKLASFGYEHVELVWAPGQYVARGGIVDFFDPAHPLPLRVEFFDEEVASIRTFSPEDQRSVKRLETVELHGLEGGVPRAAESPLEHLPKRLSVVLVEPKEIEHQGEAYVWLWNGLREQGEVPEIPTWQEAALVLSSRERVRLSRGISPRSVRTAFREVPKFRGRWDDVESACSEWVRDGFRIAVCSSSEELLSWGARRGFETASGVLSGGFIDGERRLALLSDAELVGIVPQRDPPGAQWSAAPREWTERLPAGSWVVHEEYGVARFLGMQQVAGPFGDQEYFVLEFAHDRKLFVPVAQAHRIIPYDAPAGEDPAPDSLKGGRWKKSMERARERAREVAEALIGAYAAREIADGFACAPDGDVLHRFEKSFPHRETADQLRAIGEIKRDMESRAPMDRLLVGDVGFGKTEVAMRAAVKAVESGRQVAVLVPTTVLAQQHDAVFRGRLAAFPLSVASLSRFVTPKETRRILKEAAEGRVDILIGTHRMLRGDVVFKDLGLLIVDEEHRFGVLHKEGIKAKHPEVDILTLSATPIPRTLSLALGGLRGISLLATPPAHRYPVVTVSGVWSEELVRKALVRELARGGQAFFVHNRIRTLESRRALLARMVPGAKIVVAHGRLAEHELEHSMLEFAEGRADILLCTTIVESGLDIPRANTLIVDDAHEMGLAQLYQLRGRVGRRSEQAFAFFLYPQETELTQEAQERLDAISEMTSFGGYELARRDLEIRGGGDLIGASQHGHVERVGFFLYCAMIEEELKKLAGKHEHRVELEVTVPLGISRSYIPQESVRVTLYRRILRADTPEEIEALAREMVDRFGPMPANVSTFLDVSRIRVLGAAFGVQCLRSSPDVTSVAGSASSLLTLARGWPGWLLGEQGLCGPGGAPGLAALRRRMQELAHREVFAGREPAENEAT